MKSKKINNLYEGTSTEHELNCSPQAKDFDRIKAIRREKIVFE